MPNSPFADKTSEEHFEALIDVIKARRTTVVIGAGLAQQAGLPGWPELIDALFNEAGLSSGEFVASQAKHQVEKLRLALGGEEYLAALRKTLDHPGLLLPQGYLQLSEIPFQRFATTNIDELLFVMAANNDRDPEALLYAYPNGDYRSEQRYYYLHGRLRTALEWSDLVLGTTDYGKAYGQHGDVRHVLTNVLTGPVLFVGSSISDPALKSILELLQDNRISGLHWGGRTSERYQASPDWFALRAANKHELTTPSFAADSIPDADIPRLLTYASAEYPDIKFIWYDYDANHSGLTKILDRLRSEMWQAFGRSSRFLEIAPELEELARTSKPSTQEIGRALLRLGIPTNRRHFFQYAVPNWLSILWNSGELRAFEEPRKGADGNYYAESWDAGEFIVRSAPHSPDTILDMVRMLHTENWSVLYSLARALNALPADVVTQAAQYIAGWFDSRFTAGSVVTLALLDVFERLVSERQWDAALALYAVLAVWRKRENFDA